MANSQDKIPTGKVQRATRFLKTGAKVGGNYLKHYTKKAFDSSVTREELDKKNAEDIFESLSELKGSALKVAQMVSMDKNILPKAYTDVFALAQHNAPPLSYPLVVKTFNKYFDKSPTELFDSFSKDALHAASIGQVHEAKVDGKRLAVKVQYPGVGDSVVSDLNMVKPFVTTVMSIPDHEIEEHFSEVKDRLLEETDYELELKRGMEISTACAHIEELYFPTYYPEYSSKRVLTMDWIEGMHFEDFLKTNPSQELRNKIGLTLWKFYDFQVNTLKRVHADPHPGNYLIAEDGRVGILDFGCVKDIPEDFYQEFFRLVRPDYLDDPVASEKIFEELGFIFPEDTPEDREAYVNIFSEGIRLLGRPFFQPSFDFSDKAYFKEIFKMGEGLSKNKMLRKSKRSRGNSHGIYINRTYFGLYNILHMLGANIETPTTFPGWNSTRPS